MTDALTFLPWLRRGLAQAIDVIDDDPGAPLAAGASVTAWVDVEGERAEREIRLQGPESVIGLSAGQVLREEPRADSADVAPNYFPFVELAAPVPWLLTPARADDLGRLRPWLVLVAVREQEGVSLSSRPQTPLQVLRIEPPAAPARELPDLVESWAWAHVQSLVALADVEAAVTGTTREVVARLVCPRRLLPDSAWLACVVPAFAPGHARGLGEPVAEGAELAPAWVVTDLGEAFELPVYHHWRFTTGARGDFEALCRRLKPDGGGADLGRFALEVGDPGLVTPAGRSVRLDMEGALETPGVASRPWNAAHKESFQREIRKLLDTGATRRRYNSLADPVVAPPLYGGWPAGTARVPEKGWVREINEHPVRRASAGLGAAVVRADQEALVAAAWEQAGELRATLSALNSACLGVEVARSLTRRAATLPDPDLLQLTARLHAFLPTGSTTVRGRLAASAVPGGLVSPAFLRQTRPGTALARDWRAMTGLSAARLAADQVHATIAATSPQAGDDLKPALSFAALHLPWGAWVTDRTLTDVVDPPLPADPDPGLVAEVDRLLGARVGSARQPPPAARAIVVRPPWLPTSDVSGIAATVRAVLDPLSSVRANVLGRMPALAGTLPEGGLPTTVALGPVFEDPLSDDLTRLGTSWMLPGVERLRRNRVRLVAVNPSFVGACLIGANDQLARELLWRGYPVNMRATFFHRFWDYVDDPPRTDIDDLSGWRRRATIAQNMDADAVESTVIVVRGDIVRRYPSAHYFLQEAALDGDEATPVEGGITFEPIFLGALDRDTVFFGFEPDAGTVRGDRCNGCPGYFLAIEEQAGAPRLGLDEAKPKHFTEDLPKSWNRLSWGHLVGSQAELDALTHARADNERLAGLELEGVTWGRNAAHLARACWQRPFRMYIHADLLV